MNYFHAYIYLIIFIKITFVLMSITHLYLKSTGKEDSDLDKKIVFIKEKFEFVFIVLMSLLLIYLFNPRHNNRNNLIDRETKLLLYLFGFILLITADWKEFIYESKWFKYLQQILGNKNDE